MTTENTVAPWYRQPWFWFLLIFPGASIIWCTIAITVAMNSNNSMVTDDYSKEGRGINMEIARDQKAIDLNLQAGLSFTDAELRLAIEGPADQRQAPYLILNLYHPTLDTRDRTIQLQQTGIGQYRAELPRNLDGRWYLDLRGPSNDWRLKGEVTLPATSTLNLEAAANKG
ncbi:FixH family protein [Marinobacter salicampi]|uniref:FixH family protein n=1 Tax=Marinobacter salicampi TaxID=435907 RepID=UPI00140BED61|nr:FixH family protein [Marinobacter salicampi]